MINKINVILPILLASTLAQADVIDSPEVLQSLQEDMQEYSRIATQTRQNVDYMPYVISAWNSDELNQLGISTLREALGLVPGVDISIGTVGTTVPIFRGSNPFAMGQSTLLIDGVVVNDKMTGGYNQFLDMPVNMIQRIEVVRGPGSLLSHVSGYAGSIHVITKANRDDGLSVSNELFAALGSNKYREGGFIVSHEEDDFSISSDLFYKEHKQTLPVAIDRYGNSGDSQQKLENYSLGVNAQQDNFSVKARLSDRDSGASYGQSFSLSEDESDYLSIENNYIDFNYLLDISKDVKIELEVGYIELIRQLQNKVIPDGATVGTTIFPNGRYFLVNIHEKTFNERIELQIDTFDSHRINLGINAYQANMASTEGRASTDNLQTFSTFDILKNTPRRLYSFYADDLIDFTEKTSIQLGFKFDHYSDVDDHFSPRVAMVHRHDNENIYKFMYTHSYRVPSWREQYLNVQAFFRSTPDIKAELADTYELSYIRKIDLKSYLKLNAFYLSNKEQIHAQNPSHTFKNNSDNDLYGVEIEYKKHFSDKDQFYFNYSYVEGENVDDKLASAAESMAKAYYIHNITDSLSLSAVAKFVDEKNRIEADPRDDVDSYALVDMSMRYQYKPADIDINLSVKNLFDETYYLPSPENTYPDDFEQEGRVIFIGLRKTF